MAFRLSLLVLGVGLTFSPMCFSETITTTSLVSSTVDSVINTIYAIFGSTLPKSKEEKLETQEKFLEEIYAYREASRTAQENKTASSQMSEELRAAVEAEQKAYLEQRKEQGIISIPSEELSEEASLSRLENIAIEEIKGLKLELQKEKIKEAGLSPQN